ncbi:Fe2+-dependent dioxygenase [Sphingomonas tabacisoli]|uniref:Fe2+-dependent dioxygenase n=1 Tax=Sphingomonas tabacisoli TaxID=2249466 RepID=A0ABW4HZU9_9SPHN
MFKEIPDLLSAEALRQLREIAAAAPFIDGRITNPHNTAKQNLQLHDQSAYQRSSQLLMQALMAHEDFRNFAMPVAVAPPMLTRYQPGMRYGAHADAAVIRLPTGPIRSDLSCTIFVNDPGNYEGGELTVHLGTRPVPFKGLAGSAIVYPSDTLHEVAPVTRGERLVAISFIQSRIADPFRREILYEMNEVAALEGLGMRPENYTRMRLLQERLLRYWTDKP